MPNAVTTVTNINGYTTPIGNRALAVKEIAWNTGNYPAGGFPIGKQTFGLRGIDTAWGGISNGGHYYVETQVLTPGASQVSVRLFVLSTGIEVATGAALTADYVTIGVIGG